MRLTHTKQDEEEQCGMSEAEQLSQEGVAQCKEVCVEKVVAH